MQIADLISKLRGKIIAVVRGATFLINARSTATLEWRRRGEERRRKEGTMGVGGASGFMHQFE